MRVYYFQPTSVLRAVSKRRKPQMWMNSRAAGEGLGGGAWLWVPGLLRHVDLCPHLLQSS